LEYLSSVSSISVGRQSFKQAFSDHSTSSISPGFQVLSNHESSGP
jgi:hypothetical protein